MKFTEITSHLFQLVYDRLKPYHFILNNRPAVIAYSGGKDSTLLAKFYDYLFLNSLCPEPIVFHLDHSIRDNALQENEILLEMKKNFSKVFVKKKTFQNFPNVLKKV